MTHFTSSEIDFIKNNLDKPNRWIADQLKRSIWSIDHKVISLGFKKIYNQKKHKDLCKTISENELAYCLGVLASDGCITTKNNKNGSIVKRFSLTVSIEDSDFLISIFKLLTGDIVNFTIKPPSIGKKNKVHYQCTLPNFIEIAEQFGITANKSKTLNVHLDNKNKNFKYYFLRGVIDGDGYVPKKFSKIGIVSASKDFIDCLARNFSGKISKRKSGNYWDFYLDHSEDNNLPIEEYMLKRKNEKIINIQNHSLKRHIEN